MNISHRIKEINSKQTRNIHPAIMEELWRCLLFFFLAENVCQVEEFQNKIIRMLLKFVVYNKLFKWIAGWFSKLVSVLSLL